MCNEIIIFLINGYCCNKLSPLNYYHSEKALQSHPRSHQKVFGAGQGGRLNHYPRGRPHWHVTGHYYHSSHYEVNACLLLSHTDYIKTLVCHTSLLVSNCFINIFA